MVLVMIMIMVMMMMMMIKMLIMMRYQYPRLVAATGEDIMCYMTRIICISDANDYDDSDDDGVYVYDDDDGDYDNEWIVITPHLMIELVPKQFKLLSVTALLSESSLQVLHLR